MFEKLEEIRRKYEEVRARLADPAFVQDHRAVRDAQKTLSEFEPIIAKNEEHRRLSRELEGARELVESLSPGDELHAMAAAERAELIARLDRIAKANGCTILATNDVHYHEPERRPLQDVMACIREKVTLASAGYLLNPNAERHLKSPEEMV